MIASSPDDVQPVFEAIAERSNRIVDGRSTAVYSLVDDVLHLMAFTPTSPEADATLRAFFPRPLAQVNWGEPIRRGEIGQILDMHDPSVAPEGKKLAERRGFRSLMVVPLLSEQKANRCDQRDACDARQVSRPPCPAAADLRRSGRDRYFECRAVPAKCSNARRICRDPSTTFALRRTA